MCIAYVMSPLQLQLNFDGPYFGRVYTNIFTFCFKYSFLTLLEVKYGPVFQSRDRAEADRRPRLRQLDARCSAIINRNAFLKMSQVDTVDLAGTHHARTVCRHAQGPNSKGGS